jgi:hypothetical protein
MIETLQVAGLWLIGSAVLLLCYRVFRLQRTWESIRDKLGVVVVLLLASEGRAQPKKDVGPPVPPATWESECDEALLDARQLPERVRKYTRYQTAAFEDQADLDGWYKLLTAHLRSIAHEAEPPRPRKVTPTLWAVNLEECGIDPYFYGRLLLRDTYSHTQRTEDGRKPLKELPALAPWLGPSGKSLGDAVASQVPILRVSWFFMETSIQEGRGKPGEGTGYYDAIGVTNRVDFEKLIGTDAKAAERLKREWQAIVKDSGIAWNSRQVFRRDSLGGGQWVTLDNLDDPKAARNAIRNLDADFAHQAEEHYGIGIGGLPVYLLCNDKGELQNSAPDRVGPDKTRTGNRTTVDICRSCVRCHKEILRPVDNWLQETFRDATLAKLPYERANRLRGLYFRDMTAKLEEDRVRFANTLMQSTGLKPAEWSALTIKLADWYDERRLTLEDTARELGRSPVLWRATLDAVAAQGVLDPVFADLRKPKGTIRRDHWEESYPTAQTYFGGQKP